MERGRSILSELEDKLGLPKLSKVTETLDRFPDAKRLRLIKEVLTAAEKVSQSAPELDKVIALIREVNAIEVDKLKDLEKVLRRIEAIIRKAPDNLLEVLTSLKSE